MMTAPLKSKLSKLKDAYYSGDRIGALRIAAKFHDLGAEKENITRAWAAIQNPEFYREIGQEPDAMIALGYDAMVRRYKLDAGA